MKKSKKSKQPIVESVHLGNLSYDDISSFASTGFKPLHDYKVTYRDIYNSVVIFRVPKSTFIESINKCSRILTLDYCIQNRLNFPTLTLESVTIIVD